MQSGVKISACTYFHALAQADGCGVCHRAIAAESSKKELQHTVLGVVQPGDTIPIPYGWHKAGELFHMLQLCSAQSALQSSFLIGYTQSMTHLATGSASIAQLCKKRAQVYSSGVFLLVHCETHAYGEQSMKPFPISYHETNQSSSYTHNQFTKPCFCTAALCAC